MVVIILPDGGIFLAPLLYRMGNAGGFERPQKKRRVTIFFQISLVSVAITACGYFFGNAEPVERAHGHFQPGMAGVPVRTAA